jgi:cell division septation protein DedD
MITKVILACLSVVALTACIPLNSGEQLKGFAPVVQGNPQSDYAILPCGNLSEIEARVRSQFKAARDNPAVNQGRLGLLQSQLADVQNAHQTKACAPIRQFATETAVAEGDAETAPTQRIPAVTASPQRVTAGQQQFLQIATFNDRQNVDDATRYFRSRGFQVQNRSTIPAGQPLVRVLIGPLADTAAKRSASNTARQYGIKDAFWTVE